MSLIGLDLGTSSCKAALLSEEGTCLATSVRDYAIRATENGQFELDPAAVVSTALHCIGSVTARARERPRAVGIAAAGEAVVPINEEGEALDAILLSADRRAFAEFHDLVGQGEEELFIRETALRPLPHYSIYKMMWWKKHRPAIYDRAACFVTLAGLVGAKLGAPPLIDRSLAARMGAFAPAACDWSEAVLTSTAICRRKLPSIADSGTAIGEVSPSITASLGLEPQARIVLGGLDRACAAFAAGLVSATDAALLDLGTIAAVLAVEPEATALELDAPVTPHVVPGLVTAIGGAQAGTSTLRWYRAQFVHPTGADGDAAESSEIANMISSAAAKPTTVLCLPHFAGSRFAFQDPVATAALTGITFATTGTDIVRALIDGVAYEIGVVVDRLVSYGAGITRLVATGGGSQSPEWQQIIADALELPIESTSTRYATAIGAGLLAGVGAGVFVDCSDAAEHAVARERTYEPSSTGSQYHLHRREEFRGLYEALFRERERRITAGDVRKDA